MLVIDEDSSDCLRVRRRMKIWWPGLLVPLGLLVWAAGGFDWFTAALGAEAPTGLPRALAALFIATFFLSFFAFLSDTQRLTVSAGRLEYLWHFGPIPFRRRQAALVDVQSITCEDDEGTYWMVVKTTGWEARFGQEPLGDVLLEVQGKLTRLVEAARRAQGLPPPMPVTAPPPGPVVRRQRDRKRR